MRRILFAIVLLSLAGCACPSQPSGHEATRIETDQKTGAVRIISDNREIARFDAEGLHTQFFISEDPSHPNNARPRKAEPKH